MNMMIGFVITAVIAGIVNVGAVDTKITIYFNPPTAPVKVEQLVVGRFEHIQQGSIMRASVTLIEDHGYYMLVDTPSATDLVAKEKMLRGLTNSKVYPGQVQLVVTTHGHPDHVGQGNFFPNSRHFFASYEYTGDNYIKTELFTTDVMNVTKNIELWNTPGHTNTDISAIVRNVPCCGTIGVVGDLFYSEADAAGNNTEWIADAWNAEVGQVSRAKVICNVDHVVPGHGKIFKVTEEMKRAYECNVTSTTTSTTVTTTTVTTTVPASTTTLPTPSPLPIVPMNLNSNAVNDQPIQSIGVTTMVPMASTTLDNSFVTVDHWQNSNENSVNFEPSNPISTAAPQPIQNEAPYQPSVYPQPESPSDTAFMSAMTAQPVPQAQQNPPNAYSNGIYAVPAAGPGPAAPVAVPPLSDHLAYMFPGYQVRNPNAPQGMILPMFETAAANFVNYLNQPMNAAPCMHVRSVKEVPCVPEPMDYLDIIKMAIKRFANLGIAKTVKRNLLE
uniref:Lactamase_B domain-containing protein n=1 Tax=Panagrellus redivivus TaxID=6233 RepID=A0A7E4V8U9_PANRE